MTERDAGEFAAMQKPVPGQQRILGIVAFEVVHRVEEILPAGLTLAPREGAKCVEPARDRRDEPAFAAAVSRDRTKDGRLRLVGPIGETEPSTEERSVGKECVSTL